MTSDEVSVRHCAKVKSWNQQTFPAGKFGCSSFRLPTNEIKLQVVIFPSLATVFLSKVNKVVKNSPNLILVPTKTCFEEEVNILPFRPYIRSVSTTSAWSSCTLSRRLMRGLSYIALLRRRKHVRPCSADEARDLHAYYVYSYRGLLTIRCFLSSTRLA